MQESFLSFYVANNKTPPKIGGVAVGNFDYSSTFFPR
jgi:hypothetical protein